MVETPAVIPRASLQVPVALQSEPRLSGAEVQDELHRPRQTLGPWDPGVFFPAEVLFWEKMVVRAFNLWAMLGLWAATHCNNKDGGFRISV